MSGVWLKYVEAHHLDVYARKAIELPEVYSVVFYNGLEEKPDRETITVDTERGKWLACLKQNLIRRSGRKDSQMMALKLE